MKKVIIFLLAAACLTALAVDVSAGNYGQGKPNNFCAVFQIYPNSQITIEGTVTGSCTGQGSRTGSGITVDTGTETVSVYGIGPYWYWDAKQVARPAVGDDVVIDARDVTYPDGIRTMAVSITINDETIELRDETTGCPLWQGRGRRK